MVGFLAGGGLGQWGGKEASHPITPRPRGDQAAPGDTRSIAFPVAASTVFTTIFSIFFR